MYDEAHPLLRLSNWINEILCDCKIKNNQRRTPQYTTGKTKRQTLNEYDIDFFC